MDASTIAPHARPVHVRARPELTGDRRVGVLLSHGFTGSPASVRPWAEHLGALGYAVRAPLLPGHGTTWQDLNTRRWSQWYAQVQHAFEALCLENDTVVVGGLSMGGTLALRLAAEHPDRVAGVVVVNPAVASARLDLRLLPVLQHLVGSLPGICDDIKKPGVSEQAYPRTPLKALRSFVGTWPATVQALPRMTAPLLYLRSAVDHVVDDRSEHRILEAIGSHDVTRVRLENSYHVATLDHDAPRVFEESARFVARVATTTA